MDPEAVLIAFVRGDVDLTVFQDLNGIDIEVMPSSLQVKEESELPVVRPSIGDIATGLLSSQGPDGRDWARTVLALTCVDLSSLEDEAAGDKLLESIWDMAGGGIPGSDAIDLARQLSA